MMLSERISKINPSPTLAITAKANKMKADGINVIGFGAGEPDFDTPVNIKDAAKNALDKGFTKYTPTSGIKVLKDAICEKFKKDNNLNYLPTEILVSCGAKHSIFNAILTLCNEGDEVIIPSPYWVSYPEMVKIAGAVPVILETTEQSGFKITPEQLKKAITPKTKLFILNSPSNPTGMVYEEQELKKLSEVIVSAGIYCISDEIYEKIAYDSIKHVSIASLNDNIKKLTLVVNGVSKAYSMTGWRIGYMAGPKEIIQRMSNLQDHSTSNPTSIAQYASLEALEGPQEDIGKMVEAFHKRRDLIVEKINSIKGMSCVMPQGAFYIFANIKETFGKKYENQVISDSFTFTDILLDNAHVAVIPGAVFGYDDCIRISYAISETNILTGMERIKEFISKLK